MTTAAIVGGQHSDSLSTATTSSSSTEDESYNGNIYYQKAQ